jgi:anti-sigma regulatory factor (Ser/Thr protein kinase)
LYDSLHSMHDFRHEALFYSGEEEFLAGTVPFVRDGLWAGEPVLVAVGERKTTALKDALGDDSDAVQFVDMEALGRNPARIIPAWREFVAARPAGARPVRGIGEPIWPGRSPAEVDECHHHESLLNLAFADTPEFWLLCPYDTAGLGPAVVREARATHPYVTEGATSRSSERYSAVRPARPFEGELAPPACRPGALAFGAHQLSRVRHFVADRAELAGLPADRASDLVLAVSEVATNSVIHGGGHGTLRVWTENGSLMCEVRDDGTFTDPLAGRVRPTPAQADGRGLWLANALCDLVQIRSSRNGNVVRLHMAISRP